MVLDSSIGFVIYKQPNTYKKQIIKGDWEKFLNQNEGFVISSFNNKKKYILTNPNRNIEEDEVIKIFQNNKDYHNTNSYIDKGKYLNQLDLFIDACNEKLQKVISSRIIKYSIDKDFDIYKLYKKIAKKYKEAFVYILNIPNEGMWIGATPETLIKLSEYESYTIALAGSKKANNKNLWSNKENVEHEYVVQDILNKLKTNNVLYEKQDTKTINAGKVSHLKTKIKIKSKIDNISKIINKLHPTSAVCGMPQRKAFEFIEENEPYKREFYTGYLGELSNKNTWIFVNLRCLQVFDSNLTIYVGGGITKDSESKKEWEETQLKSKTLLSVIEKI